MVRITKTPKDRKLELIDTARRLFQIKGYDKVTMQDVMDSLDIAKGTIYHYFKSKEELFEAVVENIVDTNSERMQILMQETTGTALDKIQVLVAAGNISLENEKILHVLHKRSNDAMHTRLLAVALIKQAPLYEKLIQQGCDEGIFQTKNPLECAELVLAGVQFLTDVGIYPWSQEDLHRRAKAFPSLIEQLLQAPPGSFQFMLKNTKI